jgi:pentatricopeptide repeat protein
MRITTVLAVTALTLFHCTPFSRAQDADESLRNQALALNNITGDAAIRGKILELNKDKAALRKLLAEAVTLAKEGEKGKDDKKGEKDSPFNYTGAWILAVSAHNLRDFDTADTFYKICIEHAVQLEDSKKQSKVFEAMIDLYEREKKFSEAFFICEKLLDLAEKDESTNQDQRPFVYDKMVQILARQKKFDKAIELCDELIEKYKPIAWFFGRRKAEVYREWGKFDQSIEEYEKVQQQLEDSDRPDRDRVIERYVKYPLTAVYVDAGKPDKAIEILDELVKEHPDVSTYNNDLGYILADNDKRLDEAERLVRKAMELDREARKMRKPAAADDDEDDDAAARDKDNPAYIDSLAWVFFKQKKYAEARDVLLEAVKEEDGQHVEIFDHLGDIYMALGQKDDAVKTWQKALTLENQSNRDDVRKVAIKKKIESNK